MDRSWQRSVVPQGPRPMRSSKTSPRQPLWGNACFSSHQNSKAHLFGWGKKDQEIHTPSQQLFFSGPFWKETIELPERPSTWIPPHKQPPWSYPRSPSHLSDCSFHVRSLQLPEKSLRKKGRTRLHWCCKVPCWCYMLFDVVMWQWLFIWSFTKPQPIKPTQRLPPNDAPLFGSPEWGASKWFLVGQKGREVGVDVITPGLADPPPKLPHSGGRGDGYFGSQRKKMQLQLMIYVFFLMIYVIFEGGPKIGNLLAIYLRYSVLSRLSPLIAGLPCWSFPLETTHFWPSVERVDDGIFSKPTAMLLAAFLIFFVFFHI